MQHLQQQQQQQILGYNTGNNVGSSFNAVSLLPIQCYNTPSQLGSAMPCLPNFLSNASYVPAFLPNFVPAGLTGGNGLYTGVTGSLAGSLGVVAPPISGFTLDNMGNLVPSRPLHLPPNQGVMPPF